MKTNIDRVDRQTDSQTDRKTDRQTDRQTDRHTEYYGPSLLLQLCSVRSSSVNIFEALTTN